jgi:hypothetical protein
MVGCSPGMGPRETSQEVYPAQKMHTLLPSTLQYLMSHLAVSKVDVPDGEAPMVTVAKVVTTTTGTVPLDEDEFEVEVGLSCEGDMMVLGSLLVGP